jgi:hypothetical protein
MKSKHFSVLALAAVALLVVAVFASAAQAREPATGYGEFAGCPSPEENASVFFCLNNTITSGNFKMGSKNVPIEKPISLVGGVNFAGEFFSNSKGGLSKAKQKVPGGIIGLTGLTWLAEILGSEALTLYATTELAGKVGNPLGETLSLPVKIHLENSTGVLGPNCYVGSTSNPIMLNLTEGTTAPPLPNKPISGHMYEHEIEHPPYETITFAGIKLVDNAFAAPGASGCTLTLFGFIPISLNSLVNAQSGLPSAAGNNETIQNVNSDIVQRRFAYP